MCSVGSCVCNKDGPRSFESIRANFGDFYSLYLFLMRDFLPCQQLSLYIFEFWLLLVIERYCSTNTRNMCSTEPQLDAIVIGGGPAGLAAAMALGRACRTVAVFDSQEYRNENASLMHNVLGHDGQKPELYRAGVVRDMMDKYDTITFVDTEVIDVKHIADGRRAFFRVKNRTGELWYGLKLILASGSKDILPDIDGYKDLWGRGM